jgi:hypothetical protein
MDDVQVFKKGDRVCGINAHKRKCGVVVEEQEQSSPWVKLKWDNGKRVSSIYASDLTLEVK